MSEDSIGSIWFRREYLIGERLLVFEISLPPFGSPAAFTTCPHSTHVQLRSSIENVNTPSLQEKGYVRLSFKVPRQGTPSRL